MRNVLEMDHNIIYYYHHLTLCRQWTILKYSPTQIHHFHKKSSQFGSHSFNYLTKTNKTFRKSKERWELWPITKNQTQKMFGTDHSQSEKCRILIIYYKNIYIITFLYFLINGKKDAENNSLSKKLKSVK